jgi:hypothetical protein
MLSVVAHVSRVSLGTQTIEISTRLGRKFPKFTIFTENNLKGVFKKYISFLLLSA